jgi:hypothetical protein
MGSSVNPSPRSAGRLSALYLRLAVVRTDEKHGTVRTRMKLFLRILKNLASCWALSTVVTCSPTILLGL